MLLEPHDKDVPLFIYIVAGAMLCVIGTTLVMMAAVINICRKHRARNQMKMVFKVWSICRALGWDFFDEIPCSKCKGHTIYICVVANFACMIWV